MPIPTVGYAAVAADKPLQLHTFECRDLNPDDLHIEIKYCGVCHSDIHGVRNEHGLATFPMVPGHEIAGIVKNIGSKVTKFKIGDRVGVGCFVGRCNSCDACMRDDDSYCMGRTFTYNKQLPDGSYSKGGYAKDIVVPEFFGLKFPESIPLEKCAPLLCAGITTYSAIKFYGFDKAGQKIGVHGLGGLGHMAVQLMNAMGVYVVVLSHSESKREVAYKLGASEFVLMNDTDKLKLYAEKLNGVLDTTSGIKELNKLLGLVKYGCTVCPVGVAPKGFEYSIAPYELITRRKQVGGSLVGGIKETQEMLDFCAEKQIAPWVEMIEMENVEKAFDRVCKSDIFFRFVIDMQKFNPKI